LRRFTPVLVEIRPPEAAAEKRLDDLWGQRVGMVHGTAYTKRAVQPIDVEPRLYQRNGHTGRLYERLSDAELVRKATSGDSQALDVLVERYAPRVNRLASQLLDDLEDARDAAQESLVKLCTRLRQFRGEAQFATWLHRLVVNTCRDRMAFQRVRRTEPFPIEEPATDEESDPWRLATLTDLRRDLAEALARLSPKQRAAVVLRDSFGLSYAEIARVSRIPVGTAKCYVHRARASVKAYLEELARA
jgi:RNA polymerase sigma-70 factor (ECF subfamily)